MVARLGFWSRRLQAPTAMHGPQISRAADNVLPVFSPGTVRIGPVYQRQCESP